MRQVIHLFVVDSARRAALAARIGPRWLLPVLSCGERVRAGPLVARWCDERGFPADVAGQWLGRVTDHAADWLMVIAAVGSPAPGAGLEWTSFQALAADAAVLEYQHWAVARVLDRDRPPSVNGPFGHLAWPAAVRAWIAAATGSVPSAVVPYRVGPHEIVLGAECARGRVYFKGVVEERATEARLTQALAAMAPDFFAPTLALEQQDDGSLWWLTAACPGEAGRDAHLTAGALARIQQRAIDTHVERLGLPAIDLDSAARWAGEGMGDSACASVVTDACARVAAADVPRSWIPLDLDPTNVLTDDDGRVRFIDLDDSYVGPAPLAMAGFAQRCRGRAAYRTYEQSWSRCLDRLGWRQFEVAVTAHQAWLGWQRLKRHVARGDVDAPLDRIELRIRERLAQAVYRCR